MKYIIFSLLIAFTNICCKAQTPIISTVDWENNNNNIELTNGCYLKDIENKFAPFLGTWLWQNSNSSLEIQLTKLEMVFDGHIYADYIVGKYKYIENGNIKINSLNININSSNINRWDFFTGSGYDGDTIKYFSIVDKEKSLYCNLKLTLTGPEILEWKVWRSDGGKQPDGFTFPTELILIKQ